MDFQHTPVLLEETIRYLDIRQDGVYVDGTVGGAGHSKKILELLSEKGLLICLDQDEKAIEAAGKKLEGAKNVILLKTNLVNLISVCNSLGVSKVDGILFDLGVSSHQFDTPERGFSYRFDSKLDMRMDADSELTAYDVVNGYEEAELRRIIKEYGEERFASRITGKIVERRKIKPIETTFELVEVIKEAIPKKQRMDGHPAKQTFQAIRIEVNKELEVLEKAIEDAIEMLAPFGRLCIITFHSLEDRIVKTKFNNFENPCTCPPDFPICVCGKKPKGKAVTKKPILPSQEEMERNPRAKSAKLRVFQSN